MPPIAVNGNSLNISGLHHNGSKILAMAGFEPVDEHILIEAAKIGSRLISLDEGINLHADMVTRFYAFRSGELFTFTVNGHGFQWGRKEITEAELREFANVPEDDVFILEQGDAEPRILVANDKVTLGDPGTEHLKTEKRLITVFYDDDAKQIPRCTYTTEELMTIFGVQAGYLLNLADEHGLHTLKPNQRTHVKDGMRFFSQVPGGGSS
jgi:hypothetical protein